MRKIVQWLMIGFVVVGLTACGSGSPNGDPDTDTTPPVITIHGDNPVVITQGDTYIDAGATATDDVDGDLTNQITVTGIVDTNTTGEYQLVYHVEDSAGNEATAERIVRVVTQVQEQVLDLTDFQNIYTGIIEVNDNMLEVFGSGYREGSRACTNQKFNFLQSEIYYKWKPGADTNYATYGFSLHKSLTEEDKIFSYGPFTTDHSWNGSYVINNDQEYYTRVIINSTKTLKIITSIGNYDNNNGEIIREDTKDLYDDGLIYLNSTHFCFSIWDNYGGTEASAIMYEIKIKKSN